MSAPPPNPEARQITVRGVVQGVGFRPFVYRLARELDVAGWVLNDGDGVRIHVEGAADRLDAFETRLRTDAPPAADVVSLESAAVERETHDGFTIRPSPGAAAPTVRISPDLCVCGDCLRELRDANDPRFHYAYINCTNCGPRYSIIRALPYDRPHTTMAAWPLCEPCGRAYADPGDRRFHAQPVACPRCGPAYTLVIDDDEIARGHDAVAEAARRLRGGAILAIKGIGGYHLACAADDPDAVTALRERKFRKEKPFALMASSVERARGLVALSPAHERLLTEGARPIVLAPARAAMQLVAPDNDELGVMLPYAPLHHLLFDAGAPDPLVLTSANRSNEPIAYEDDDALDRLAGIADAFLIGERPIQRRVDDSVVTVRRGAPFMVRRSRGYAPASVGRIETDRPILAVGADLKNAIALAAHDTVFVSQHIGDLGDLATDRAFRETIDDLLDMYAIDRSQLVVAHDLHPEYVSSRLALGLPAARHVAVQHHEAHIAAALLEHALTGATVVGIALDGTGYGTDGTIWGGELFVGGLAGGFERAASLAPVRMPGGDAAARHPVQAAAAYLDVDPSVLEDEPFRFPDRFRRARSMVARDVRCITSTSAGRVFDAAAAICGFTREITFEGQAAIWLEQRARRADGPPAALPRTLDPCVLLREMVALRRAGTSVGALALGLHEALAAALAETARDLAARVSTDRFVLSGGVWQNALLTERFGAAIGDRGVVVLPSIVPANDGGIALGQIAIVAGPTVSE